MTIDRVNHLLKAISEGIQVRLGERITVGIADERARNITTALIVDIDDWIEEAQRRTYSVAGEIEDTAIGTIRPPEGK